MRRTPAQSQDATRQGGPAPGGCEQTAVLRAFYLTQNRTPCILSIEHSPTPIGGRSVTFSGDWTMTATAKIPAEGPLTHRAFPAPRYATPWPGWAHPPRPCRAKQTQFGRPNKGPNRFFYNLLHQISQRRPGRKTNPNKANSRAHSAKRRICQGLSSPDPIAVPRDDGARHRTGLQSACLSHHRESFVGWLSVSGESLGRTHSLQETAVFHGGRNDLLQRRLCRLASQYWDNMGILASRLL